MLIERREVDESAIGASSNGQEWDGSNSWKANGMRVQTSMGKRDIAWLEAGLVNVNIVESAANKQLLSAN